MHHLHRIGLPLCLALVLVCTACRGNNEPTTTGTPAAGVRVTDVSLGRSIGGDKAITDKTDDFKPNDTIYASIVTDGSAASTTLRALWTYEGGQVVDDSSRTIAATNGARTEFYISKPDGWPTGDYQLEVFLDGRSVEKKAFEVKQ